MQAVDEKFETIHLYVVREEQKKPYTVLPLLGAFLCLVGIVAVTVYSAYHPYYEHERLTLPAHFLPMTNLTTRAPIIPTGIKTYPATIAHGILTITNGSIISQTIPQGFIVGNVATDYTVFVPAGSADGYGIARVSAHALQAGQQGNLQTMQINVVIGSSLYVRNLDNFTGGKDSYSVKIVTPQDRQTALDAARTLLTSQKAQIRAFLAYPCIESPQIRNLVLGLSWTCQYVTYSIPSYMKVIHVRLVGKNLLVDVVFVPKPRIIVFK